MKLSWRDMAASLLAVCGGVVVFAKMQSYTWWQLDSWTSVLALIALIGIAIAMLYSVEWFKSDSLGLFGEIALWLLAGTVVMGSLFAETTESQFLWAAALIGVAWFTQLCAHVWHSTHTHTTHYLHIS